MTILNPCIRSIGPKDSKVVLIGEAPGQQEELAGVPFIGASGQHLDEMLKTAGFRRRDLYLTNVLFTRPPGNKLDAFLLPKRELPANYTLPPVRQGGYLHPDLIPEVERLWQELGDIRPNLIIAGGGTALWALIGKSSITKMRGTIQSSKWGKVLPILHPATVVYDWSNRPIIVRDLIKARRECEYPEIRRPKRMILVNPTLAEVEEFCDLAKKASRLSLDVETAGGTITVFGIGINAELGGAIPFTGREGNSFWSRNDEITVRRLINNLISLPIPKLFQNGLYDLQYILREGYKINLENSDDTMILHHSLYPELPKSLGFMGSVYTNESAWKLLRDREDDSNKRED